VAIQLVGLGHSGLLYGHSARMSASDQQKLVYLKPDRAEAETVD